MVGADVEIDFTEVVLANDTTLTNKYASFDIYFSGFYYNSCPSCTDAVPTGSKPDIGNFYNGNSATWGATGVMSFATDITDISFSTAFNAGSGHNISAYKDGSLVETVAPTSLWQTYGFTGIVFDEVRFNFTQAFLIDDIKFNTSAVPLPAAVWLFGSGLLGLMSIARRKKAA